MVVNKRNWFIFLVIVLIAAVVLSVAVILAWFQQSNSDSGFNTTGLRVNKSLKFVVVVTRHGNRGAYITTTYPTDPYPTNDTKAWPFGLQQLTTYGRIQMYNMGVKIRTLYNGFVDLEYFSDQFVASSTALDRTMISGSAFLAGFYPLKGSPAFVSSIPLQLVSLFSDSLDKSVDALTDCPRYSHLQSMALEEFSKVYASNLSAINNYTSIYAGTNLTGLMGFVAVFDSLLSEDIEGYTLPDWTKKVYPHPMQELMGESYKYYAAGSDGLIRIIIGSFHGKMIEIMKSKINGTLSPDRRMYYYSGHDLSLVTLQAVMDIPRPSIIGMVKPGSAMIYELHQDPDTQQYSIEVLYIDGSSENLESLISLTIPNCPGPCSFDAYVNITHKYSNVTDYNQECQLSYSPP